MLGRHWRVLPIAVVLVCATVLLTWRLGAVYLWQDEAATAVLAERMLKYGKPLAYDGRNLITMDSMADEDRATLHLRTGDVDAMLKYLVARKDFRPDTTWVNQPWGQFVAAAASLGLLGHGTWQARLPFALAGIATVLLLYLLVMRVFADRALAVLAAALLTANAFWILNARQARYYALSSLFLVLSVSAFLYWMRGGRWGAPIFVLFGWLYFQSDFGSFFPTMAVLGLAGIAVTWPRIGGVLGWFAALAAAIGPFALYYGIHDRVRAPIFPSPWARVAGTTFGFNQYVIAIPLLTMAIWILWRKRGSLDRGPRQLLATSMGILLATLVWVPIVSPAPFIRYVIHLSPIAALVGAWTIVSIGDAVVSRLGRVRWRPVILAGLGLLVGGTGLFAAPIALALRALPFQVPSTELLTRPELRAGLREVFVERPDPNRIAIDAIAARLRPNDEILVTYEDIPFMFYTDARIRGGIAAFRVEDYQAAPPRFLVVRRSFASVHWPVFERSAARSRWSEIKTGAPDVPWGNFIDPMAWPVASTGAELTVVERVGP